jgi:hypothetical protein
VITLPEVRWSPASAGAVRSADRERCREQLLVFGELDNRLDREAIRLRLIDVYLYVPRLQLFRVSPRREEMPRDRQNASYSSAGLSQ